MEVVTDRRPTEEEWADLLFAWRVCRHVKSNAIVLARGRATLGIGAGQMSRVDSVRLVGREVPGWTTCSGAALASDAFFPFADGPELAIEAGVTAIIQPGGSVRDDEVVAAADAAGVAMVFTGAATSATSGRDHAPRIRAARTVGGDVGYSRVVRAGQHVWVAGLHRGQRGRRRAGPATPGEQDGSALAHRRRLAGARRRDRRPTSSAPACSSPTSRARRRSAAPTARSSARSGRSPRCTRSAASSTRACSSRSKPTRSSSG